MKNLSGPPSVLVVDDQLCVLRAVERILRLTFGVTTARSGSEAIALLKAERFAAVISDLDMGDVSGIDVLRAAERFQPGATRVLHTGAVRPELPALIRSGLIHTILPKPACPEEMMAALEEAWAPL